MTEATSTGESPHLTTYLAEAKRAIDDTLMRLLPPTDSYPQSIHEAMRYSIFAGGKRVRSVLALATGEALGADRQRIMHLACALEMIHTYSLIHDDLPAMDNDDYRRGQLSLHRKYDEGLAILAGDGLLTLAFQVLAEIPTESDASTVLAVIHEICLAIGTSKGMIAGQVVDLSTQGKSFSAEELDYIHSAKTGALLHTSIYCAALLAGADDPPLRHLSAFGSLIGLAFQIVDDILDVEGDASQLGKTVGKDAIDRKATYPALYGLDRSREIASTLVEEAVEHLRFLGTDGEVLHRLARFITTRRF